MDHDQKVEEETFESTTWRNAVDAFTKSHKPEEYLHFLQNYSSPDDTKKQVVAQQKTASSKYSGIVAKVLDKIDIFTKMGDLAVKGAPESIGLAWTGIKLCLNSTVDDYETFQLYTGACTDIIGIMISCRVYGKSYSYKNRPPEFDELHEKVLGYIGQAYRNILEFSYQMWKYSNEHTAIRIAKGLVRSKKAIVKSSIDAIHANESQMNKFAEQASRQSLDYYQREGLQNDKTILNNLAGVLEILQRMNQESEKSGMEQAQQTFDEAYGALAPPLAMEEKLSAKIAERKEGTCMWVLDCDEFAKFKSSQGRNETCLLGAAGSGKSFLMSTMISFLRDLAEDDNSVLVGYFFITKGSDATTRPESIARSLLAQIYRVARGSFELIDECNSIVKKYLQEQKNAVKSAVKGPTEQLDDALQQCFIDIARLVGKRIYLFIDALDECTDGNPQPLVKMLQKLVQSNNVDTNVFYSSRNEGNIISLLSTTTTSFINVQDHTSNDILKIVTSEIDKLPGLTAPERDLVCDEVTRKAGPSFNYVRLAMEFMRRPWRRPLSRHLESLPDGIDSMYRRSIEQIDPVYKELLNTCLTWTLLSSRPLTVREIMDVYQQTYLIESDDATCIPLDDEHDLKQYESQINRASSAFLRIEENKTIVTVHASVREYFSRVQAARSSTEALELKEAECQCTRCIIAAENECAIYVAEIPGHIQILTTILEHLLSPSFQNKYYATVKAERAPRPKFSSSSSNRSNSSEARSRSASGGSSATHSSSPTSSVRASKLVQKGGDASPITENGEVVEDSAPQPDTNGSDAQNGNHKDHTSATPDDDEEHSDDEDVEQDAQSNSNGGTRSSSDQNSFYRLRMFDGEEFDEDGKDDNSTKTYDEDLLITPRVAGLDSRYEIHNFLWHLVQLENLYPWSERSGPDWETLKDLLTQFCSPTSKAWRLWIEEVWQQGDVLHDLQIIGYMPEGRDAIHPIHVAASAGLNSIVQMLLERNDPKELVKLETYTGMSALHGVFICQARTAARQDDLLKTLLACGADPNNPKWTRERRSPLSTALEVKHIWLDQIKLLLDHGAKVWEEENGESSCAIACLFRGTADLEVAKLLFDAGADVNQRLTWEERPIHLLMRRKIFPKELVMEMIRQGAEIDTEDDRSSRPLSFCATEGHCEGLSLLLDAGADIDDKDTQGCTALHAAADSDRADAVHLLLSRGADPMSVDANQETAFHAACDRGHEASALILFQSMIEQQCVRLALQPTGSGKITPLMKCVGHGMEAVVTLILNNCDAKEQLNKMNKRGQRALHFVTVKAKPSMARILLDKGAEVSGIDSKGRTALKTCYTNLGKKLSGNRESTIMALVEQDSQAALADMELLHMMAINASPQAIERLIQLGMDPFREDSHGWTMLQLAEQYQRSEICDLFLRKKRASNTRPTRIMPSREMERCTLSEDGLCIDRPGDGGWREIDRTLMTDHPIPAFEDRYYFEVSIQPKKERYEDGCRPTVIVGFGHKSYDDTEQFTPGTLDKFGIRSWAYRSDGANLEGAKWVNGAFRYGRGDTVGCALDNKKGTVFWTRNGQRLCETAFDSLVGRLYPMIFLQGRNKFIVNLGNDLEAKPFMWEPGNRLDFDDTVPSAADIEAEKVRYSQMAKDRKHKKVKSGGE